MADVLVDSYMTADGYYFALSDQKISGSFPNIGPVNFLCVVTAS